MADKKVVLVIDDEPFIVDMLTTFLEINGYEVRGAHNGQDGLVLVQLEKPDVLLLDLMLPDIAGFEVCERVRAMPEFAHIPVMIISARTEPESKARAMQAGANIYLTKPLKMAELVTELQKLLTAAASAPQAAVPAPQAAPPADPITPVVNPPAAETKPDSPENAAPLAPE
jgi:DNA-binding response OmpR family regulator